MRSTSRQAPAGLGARAACGLAGLALVLAFAPVSSAAIDRWYTGGFFAGLQPLFTGATNRLPVALFDVWLVVALVALAATLIRPLRAPAGSRRPAAVGTVAALVALVAGSYIWFAVAWGLNYRRTPVERRVSRVSAASADAVEALGVQAVDRLNALHASAHREGWAGEEWRATDLRAGFAAALRALGQERRFEPGRLKPTVLGAYFRMAGVDGMVSPFTLEVLANPDLLPLERPFVAAHEWAHLAGYADEAEASFVGWITCMQAGQAAQYSGWLFALWQVRAEVEAQVRQRLDARLSSGPRADMAAVAERAARGSRPRVRQASWAAYDRYLKANRVTAGVRSYSRALDLLVTTRFTPEWLPRPADAATPE